MLRSYLKIAFRNLAKHKLFTFINISGLALSMSVCLMVIITTKQELAIDRFNPAPERTYRVTSKVTNKHGQTWQLASTPIPLFAELLNNKTIVERSVTLYPAINGQASTPGKALQLHAAFTTSDVLPVFGFRLLAGNASNALQLPNSIVLADVVAQKFFGNEPALGKTINIERLGAFQVTGVMETTEHKSHIQFDAFASFSTVVQLEKSKLLPASSSNWQSFQDAYTYVVLKPGTSAAALQTTLDRLTADASQNNSNGNFRFQLQPFHKITPGSDDMYNDISRGATWGKILGPIGIALIILIAACFNYTNLSIVRSLGRAKEVGIRKVSGAKRSQIFAQYIMEALLMAFFALGLAYVLLISLSNTSVFSQGEQLVPRVSLDPVVLMLFAAFSVFTGLLAGALPAWILSSFKPLEVLKNVSLTRLFGNLNLRKSLIVFQLSLSLVVSIFLLSFYRQFDHMGAVAAYDQRAANILNIPLNGTDPALLASELRTLGNINNITATAANIGKRAGRSIDINAIRFNYLSADTAFSNVLQLQVATGRNIARQGEALINEKAVLALGYKSNAAAIGQFLQVNDSTRLAITGITKDFTYENVGRNIAPMIISYDPGNINRLLVQTDDNNHDNTEKQIAAAWAALYPGKTFQYTWLKEEIQEANSQRSAVSLLGYLAFMTIVIAGLGLLALVIYSTESRRKEISIRKVMGAGVNSLLWLLSRGFIKLLFIAGCIAFPIGYVLSALFLQNFADRVPVGAGSFLLCLSVLLVIALTAILSQTYRATGANPANSLRND
ncbi:FtsX-like permease family protein [uncultured Chitinophaga sp.]|uniref:FtsX-like permease family protein n=1 Tax=uncultured Chitinophaga sp. TaxID=339340 RepID=UPI0025ED58F5|nr:FtsX-like permease family protein [uncultured Chitinophaga sp.]